VTALLFLADVFLRPRPAGARLSAAGHFLKRMKLALERKQVLAHEGGSMVRN
jgi:hypothetical protein